MRGITSVNVKGKRILLRLDLNVPIEEGKIVPGPRMTVHACTAKMLSERGAKVVILAHQGRKGDVDCIPLEQHARALEKFSELEEKVKRAVEEDGVNDEK